MAGSSSDAMHEIDEETILNNAVSSTESQQVDVISSSEPEEVNNLRIETLSYKNQNWFTFTLLLHWMDFKLFVSTLWTWMFKKENEEGTWMHDRKEYLGGLSMFSGGLSFVVSLAPPGGVLQANVGDAVLPCSPDVQMTKFNKTISNITCPGESVLAVVYPGDYIQCSRWNDLVYVSAGLVLLMLLFDVQLKRRFPVWVMQMCIILQLLGMTNVFTRSQLMTNPAEYWKSGAIWQFRLVEIWNWVLLILTILMTLRQIIWKVRDTANRTIQREIR